MANYERQTALSIQEVFARAHEQFTSRAELERSRAEPHSVTYKGGEGTVRVEAHRHGPHTVVTVFTNRLRTSRIDNVARHLLNRLPYNPNDSVKGAE